MKLSIRNILLIPLGLMIMYLSYSIMIDSHKRQILVTENAEIKNVKYGLLSIHSWKRQVSAIISKKVKEFELTSKNRKELRIQIEKALHQLLDELEIVLNEKTQEGGFFKRTVTSIIQPFIINIQDLRRRIPEFTSIILEELDNEKTREQLRFFLQEKIDEYIKEIVGEEDLSTIELIINKYECSNKEECSILLQKKVDKADFELEKKSFVIVGLFVLSFLTVLVKNSNVNAFDFAILISLSAIILIVGVSTPMIDIDARIQNFSFTIMNEQIEFDNQILFYQSKSIFDVVVVLVKTGQFQAIAVGVLIFIFSIIFPISKLLSSIAMLIKNSLYSNSIIKFFALKSSKWAMADVIVVAIFMAYIGFSGVIDSQLQQLETVREKVEIFTTDNSNFGVGFFLFLAFTIGGLFLSTKLEAKINIH